MFFQHILTLFISLLIIYVIYLLYNEYIKKDLETSDDTKTSMEIKRRIQEKERRLNELKTEDSYLKKKKLHY